MPAKKLEEIILKYDGQVPRYTSYPTAPHFSSEINADAYRSWLKKLDQNEDISLYIHVPYCKKLCWFCGCHTKITLQETPVKNYLDSLIHEIKTVTSLLSFKPKISHIHFGGGSPTILESEMFEYLLKIIHDNFEFQNDTEFAIEVDPRNVDEKKIISYQKQGVNRVSLGVQDFNHEVQIAINREQPFQLVEKIINLFRKHKINNINLDLMYGLPKQTKQHIQDNVRKSLKLNPDRIALFGYAHVPWLKTHMKMIHDDELPDNLERLRMFNAASKILEEADYLAIGIDHFAKKNDSMSIALANKKLHRNFQGYTTDKAKTMLAFGASSIGFFPNGYVQNNTKIKEYKASIADNKLATVRGFKISDDDRIRAKIIEELMCYMQVDLQKICTNFNYPIKNFDDVWEQIATLENDELITVKNKIITIKNKARQISRIVSAIFDSYFTKNIKKYSKAI